MYVCVCMRARAYFGILLKVYIPLIIEDFSNPRYNGITLRRSCAVKCTSCVGINTIIKSSIISEFPFQNRWHKIVFQLNCKKMQCCVTTSCINCFIVVVIAIKIIIISGSSFSCNVNLKAIRIPTIRRYICWRRF